MDKEWVPEEDSWSVPSFHSHVMIFSAGNDTCTAFCIFFTSQSKENGKWWQWQNQALFVLVIFWAQIWDASTNELACPLCFSLSYCVECVWGHAEEVHAGGWGDGVHQRGLRLYGCGALSVQGSLSWVHCLRGSVRGYFKIYNCVPRVISFVCTGCQFFLCFLLDESL